MTGDTIGNFLSRIKNAYMAGHKSVTAPHAKILLEVSTLLKKEGFVGDITMKEEKGKKYISVTLLYKNRKPAMSDVKRVSRPGLRSYVSKKHIPLVLGGLGIAILSTPEGIMTGKEALKKKIGGEVLCKVW